VVVVGEMQLFIPGKESGSERYQHRKERKANRGNLELRDQETKSRRSKWCLDTLNRNKIYQIVLWELNNFNQLLNAQADLSLVRSLSSYRKGQDLGRILDILDSSRIASFKAIIQSGPAYNHARS
jgi:hypothetical protein